MKTLFLLLLLTSAYAQEPVRPVRVQITATAEEQGEEVADAVRAKLNKLGNVIITDRRPDWRIVLAAAKDKCGYIGALVVMDPKGKSELSIHTAETADRLAREIAEKLDKEFFKSKR